MPTTPTFAIPYPLATDPADVPTDMRELAEAVDARLVDVDTRDDTQDASLTSLDARLDVIEAAPPGASDYLLIQDKLLAADGPIDFTGIPATFRNLELFLSLRHTAGATIVQLAAEINGDTTQSYFWIGIQATGGALTQVGGVAAGTASAYLGDIAGSAFGSRGPAWLRILDYASGRAKPYDATASIVDGLRVSFHTIGGRWIGAAAINRIRLTGNGGPNFQAGSRAMLYGVR